MSQKFRVSRFNNQQNFADLSSNQGVSDLGIQRKIFRQTFDIQHNVCITQGFADFQSDCIIRCRFPKPQAKVAELVDALALGASGGTRESSSLSFRTRIQMIINKLVENFDGG